jgi:cytochrome c-type biogenesis protein CcmH/NrfF
MAEKQQRLHASIQCSQCPGSDIASGHADAG